MGATPDESRSEEPRCPSLYVVFASGLLPVAYGGAAHLKRLVSRHLVHPTVQCGQNTLAQINTVRNRHNPSGATNRLMAIDNRSATSSTRSLVGASSANGANGSNRAGLHDWIEDASGANRSDLPGCAPELSSDDPDVLKWMELAVRNHVGKAAQSDDLTIVYLEAK